ncbi:hypothetical protein [Micromonospora cathayae]|uniref:Uncharacterized protein n=1 Tax=Micromonospora cathayae TaxID=3028804 RepID=A0ABY7ZTR6_9ACTN|nr:hypothetical protein [Micromonospora sp. HUAS 3]WDZ85418.1 hypothetical protein PVK37_02855 [Micromonospora sp. HUAS 3]
MPEPDDARLGAEFEAYRARILASVDPAGPVDVRRTVRRRHQRRVATVAAVTVAAVALPIAGFAALARHDDPPPTPGQTTPAPLPTTPPTSAVPDPTRTPSSSPTGPDGLITRAQLLATRLDLPDWEPGPACPAESVRLAGDDDTPGTVFLAGLDHGDVDRDGVVETVVRLQCVRPYGGLGQVVALERNAQGGIVVLARVMHTDVDTPEVLDAVEVRDDGTVRVRITDRLPGAPGPRQTLWRTYRWTGDGFVHSGGPTGWPVAPGASGTPTGTAPPGRPPLTVTATDLVYEPAADVGGYRGTSTVTVVNTSSRTIQHPMVTFPTSETDHPVHAEWTDCPTGVGRPDRLTCVTRPMAPGEKRRIVFPFSSTDAGPARKVVVLVQEGTGDEDATPVSGSSIRTTFTASFAD